MSEILTSPRGHAGVRLSNAWLSVEPTGEVGARRPGHVWRWYIDVDDGRSFSGDDLQGDTAADAATMLRTLQAFLLACAEAYRGWLRTGRGSENLDLFPDEVQELAYLWEDELDTGD